MATVCRLYSSRPDQPMRSTPPARAGGVLALVDATKRPFDGTYRETLTSSRNSALTTSHAGSPPSEI
jgi:hypothetical protein